MEAEKLVFDMKWNFLDNSCGELIINTGLEVIFNTAFSSKLLFRSTSWNAETLLTVTECKAGVTLNQVKQITFLAAPSSSRRLVVRWSFGPSVRGLCEKVTFRVLNGNLNLPTHLPMRQ